MYLNPVEINENENEMKVSDILGMHIGNLMWNFCLALSMHILLLSPLIRCTLRCRFVNGMVYYGVSLASDNLGGNMYRDFVLTSLVEVPANVLVIELGNR